MDKYIKYDNIRECRFFQDEEGEWILHADIINLPAADVAPVIHAQWIEKYWTTEDDWGVINHHTLTCSACAKEYQRDRGKTNYCPNCGAKMDGE